MRATSTRGGRPRVGTPNAHAGHADHRRMHEMTWTRDQALAILESPERRASEDPATLWRSVGLRKGMTVVDVGAGTGYYARVAADLVGRTGKVYAVDVSESLVELVRERSSGQPQLHPVLSRPERIPLPDGIADRVLLANLLHGVPHETVAEAVRLLREGGQLVNVDWKKESTEYGPPVEVRLSVAQAGRVLRGYGLTILHHAPFGPSHYVVVGAKGTRPLLRDPAGTRARTAADRPGGKLARIRRVIARVPRGRVVTYGGIAAAAGFPHSAQLVVRALQRADALPWHRVVAAGGRIALGGEEGREQRLRLAVEGVTFRTGRVRMERHAWIRRRRRSAPAARPGGR